MSLPPFRHTKRRDEISVEIQRSAAPKTACASCAVIVNGENSLIDVGRGLAPAASPENQNPQMLLCVCGFCYITICTPNRHCLLSRIIGGGMNPAEIQYTPRSNIEAVKTSCVEYVCLDSSDNNGRHKKVLFDTSAFEQMNNLKHLSLIYSDCNINY